MTNDWLPLSFVVILPGLCLAYYVVTVFSLYLKRGKPLSIFLAVCHRLIESPYGRFMQYFGLLFFLAAVGVVVGINLFGHLFTAFTGELLDVRSLQKPALEFFIDYAIPLSFFLFVVSLFRAARYSVSHRIKHIDGQIRTLLRPEDNQKKVVCWMVVWSELVLAGAHISLIMVVWYIMRELLQVDCLLSGLF
jgi:hypothetical protein